MFHDQKLKLLFNDPLTGTAEGMSAELRRLAIAGLTRVMQAHARPFIALGMKPVIDHKPGADPLSGDCFRLATRGHYKSHPLPVALAKLSVAGISPGLDRVAGHLVLACLKFEGSQNSELDSAKYSACLALRKLIDVNRPDLLVARLGADPYLDLANHRTQLSEWKRSGADVAEIPGLQRAVEDLERFHAFLAAQRRPQPGRERHRTPESNGAGEPQPVESKPEPVPPPADPPPTSVTDVAIRSVVPTPEISSERRRLLPFEIPRALISPDRVREAEERGEPPGEGADSFEVADPSSQQSRYVSETFALPRQRLPVGHLEVRARRTSAQALALAEPGTIRCADLQLLLSGMKGSHSPAVKAAVAAALYGGQPPDRMLAWKVANSIDELDFSLPTTFLLLDPIGFVVPLEATKILPKTANEAHPPQSPAVFLPLNPEWRGLQALRAHAEKRVGQSLFTSGELQCAAEAIKLLRAGQTSALTLTRLCGLLPQRVRDAAEDVVIQALVTGETLDANESSRLHYLQTTTDTIATAYLNAASQLHQDLDGGKTVAEMAALPFDGAIGSQRCPSPADVQAWVAQLGERTGPPPRGRPTLKRVVEFHHRYSAFVIEHLAWESGVRPHGKAMASLEPVGTMLLVDEKHKGIPALRQVPLCDHALRQWELYEAHRHWVMSFLHLTQCPPFFRVTTHGKAKALTFKQVRKLSGWPFETNANRHYFSTSLRRGGLSGAEVNALMGHAILGEETGNRYSALDVRLLRAKAVACIAARSEEDGWRLLEGFGRG